jgi:predicted alpha/beta-hydrolase family hydrolase
MRAGARAAAAAAFVAAAVGAGAVRGGEGTPGAVVTIPTKRGTQIVASVHEPAKPNGVAVVLAPGQGYHRELPLMRRSAEALAAAGFRALRFDWGYYTAKGEPSDDLSAEVDDVDAAVAYARGLPGVSKVVLAGKSLGCLVALARAARTPGDLAGLLLLTPPTAARDTPARAAALDGWGSVELPSLVVVGDRDPLCDLAGLYASLASSKVPPRVVVVPGDHGLARSKDDRSETDDNVGLAVAAVVLWTRRFTGT